MAVIETLDSEISNAINDKVNITIIQIMKKNSLLIFCVFMGITAFAQDIPVNSIVEIKFPKGTEKLTVSKAESMLIRNRKMNINESKGEFYNIGNIALRLIPDLFKTSEGYLEGRQKDIYNLLQLSPPKDYTSIIKSINNYKVLIVKYDLGSISYYTFYSISNDNTRVLNGIAEFKPSEKYEISEKMDDLLKNMRFK
jgi:hypothetical protein